MRKAFVNKNDNGDTKTHNVFNEFMVGDIVYYANVIERTGTYEVIRLKIVKLYDKALIGCEEKGMARLIGETDVENIFFDEKSAKQFIRLKSSKK